MGNPKGFLKVRREAGQYRPVCTRLGDYREVVIPRRDEKSKEQASRCMDCGTPFCHWGCPIGNYIPEWNELMHRGHWKKAFALLEATNNLPEITGRVCPAPCEYACVLGINDEPVTIRENELAIIEHAFKAGWVRPRPPRRRSGKKAAVIGSGPAGLSAAAELNKRGHRVTVFERDDKPGGILRYGIPDFKLEKKILDRRMDIWKKEGIKFRTAVNIGEDYPAPGLLKNFDAVCLCTGSRVPRDLDIKGRNLGGIYFAMDYLSQSNQRTKGRKIAFDKLIDAKGKKVVIIGGGDTGADCIGIAHRQRASCVIQIELLPQPAECRSEEYPWPRYPLLLKTSTSHEEGGERKWSILTKEFMGSNGYVEKLSCVEVEFEKSDKAACPVMKEVPGSEFEIEADLVILAIGFKHPEHSRLISDFGLRLDKQGNISTDENYMTSRKGVFSAGDMRRGQSLIVWAIYEGRQSARAIDKFFV